MALYKVEEEGSDKVRLIEADNVAAALRHAAKTRFKIGTITDPAEAARLAAGGVKVEVAGAADAPSGPQIDDAQMKAKGVPEALAILEPLGFEAEVGGGGALFMSWTHPDTKRQIVATATGGGHSMPVIDDFEIGVYPPDSDGGDALLSIASSDEEAGTLAEAVEKAIEAASAKKPPAKK